MNSRPLKIIALLFSLALASAFLYFRISTAPPSAPVAAANPSPKSPAPIPAYGLPTLPRTPDITPQYIANQMQSQPTRTMMAGSKSAPAFSATNIQSQLSRSVSPPPSQYTLPPESIREPFAPPPPDLAELRRQALFTSSKSGVIFDRKDIQPLVPLKLTPAVAPAPATSPSTAPSIVAQ